MTISTVSLEGEGRLSKDVIVETLESVVKVVSPFQNGLLVLKSPFGGQNHMSAVIESVMSNARIGRSLRVSTVQPSLYI